MRHHIVPMLYLGDFAVIVFTDVVPYLCGEVLVVAMLFEHGDGSNRRKSGQPVKGEEQMPRSLGCRAPPNTLFSCEKEIDVRRQAH